MVAQKDKGFSTSDATAAKRRWLRLPPKAGLYLAVGAGAIVGGIARWLISELMNVGFPNGLPWGTFFVNITGSFIIGFYAAYTGPDGRLFASAAQRQFVMTGFCGGYTTFSSFSLETVRLLAAGLLWMGFLYIAISIVSWLGAVWLGFALATWLSRLSR
jgi:CrcB protein